MDKFELTFMNVMPMHTRFKGIPELILRFMHFLISFFFIKKLCIVEEERLLGNMHRTRVLNRFKIVTD